MNLGTVKRAGIEIVIMRKLAPSKMNTTMQSSVAVDGLVCIKVPWRSVSFEEVSPHGHALSTADEWHTQAEHGAHSPQGCGKPDSLHQDCRQKPGAGLNLRGELSVFGQSRHGCDLAWE